MVTQIYRLLLALLKNVLWGDICKSTNHRASTTMFIACTEDPPLATAFLKQKIMDSQSSDSEPSSIPKEMHPNLNEKVLNTILSRREMPPPISKAPSQEQQLKNIANFFDSAQRNQIVLRAALDMSQDRLSVLMNFATQLTERQNILNQRLLQVSSRLKDNQKLTAEEAKLFAKLKECRAKMLTNSMKVSKLSLEAAQLQREARGPARPFTASAGANLFVLQHSQEELATLKRRLESLLEKLEEFRSHSAAENKENIINIS
ncbi:hypothetical protein OSTOST_07312 [Ostertagia ostertagi]